MILAKAMQKPMEGQVLIVKKGHMEQYFKTLMASPLCVVSASLVVSEVSGVGEEVKAYGGSSQAQGM